MSYLSWHCTHFQGVANIATRDLNDHEWDNMIVTVNHIITGAGDFLFSSKAIPAGAGTSGPTPVLTQVVALAARTSEYPIYAEKRSY
jgi:hypothetical protein